MTLVQNSEEKSQKISKYLELIHPLFSEIKLYCLVTGENSTSENDLNLFCDELCRRFESISFDDFYSVSRQLIIYNYGNTMIIAQKILEEINDFFYEINKLNENKKIFSANFVVTDDVVLCINTIGKVQAYCFEKDDLIKVNEEFNNSEFIGNGKIEFIKQYVVEKDLVSKIIFVTDDVINDEYVLNIDTSHTVEFHLNKEQKQKRYRMK